MSEQLEQTELLERHTENPEKQTYNNKEKDQKQNLLYKEYQFWFDYKLEKLLLKMQLCQTLQFVKTVKIMLGVCIMMKKIYKVIH